MNDTFRNKMTIDDVAVALGVSKTTVSRAISGKGRVSPETRERVLNFIEENDYVPNAFAKGLAQSKTCSIGINVPQDFGLTEMPFFQKCLSGVCEYAMSADYDVLISMTSTNDISQLERMVNNRKVDGIILTRTLTRDYPLEFLKTKRIPFVTIGSTRETSVIQIDNDHEGACRELTTALLRQNVGRMVLLCTNSNYVVTQTRLQGFMRAMRESGYEITPDMIIYETDDDSLERFIRDVKQNRYDCVLCMDDSICVRVLDLFRYEGIKVPKDIKIASFYNSSILERNIPAITSLEFDAKELGTVACKTLLDMIGGASVPTRSLLGYDISLKASTENLR